MRIKPSYAWAFIASAALLLTLIWATQHSWLLNTRANQLQHTVAQFLGLTPLYAKRPELLNIASHAKLQQPAATGEQNAHYVVLGQIHNPLLIPLRAPTIVLQQIDRDNRLVQEQTFLPPQWGYQTPSIAAGDLVSFELQLSKWPRHSWGYQLRLSD